MSVEFSYRLLLFFVSVGVLQTALDLIVLFSWRAFVRSRGWSAWWYRVPIALGVVLFFTFPFTVYLRQTELHPSLLNKVLHRTLTYWYMPKIAVVAGIVGYWIMRWIEKHFSPRVVSGVWAVYDWSKNVFTRLRRNIANAWKQAAMWDSGKPLSSTFPFRILRTVRLLFIPNDIANLPQPSINQPSSASLSRRAFLEKSAKLAGYGLAAAPVLVLGVDVVYTLYDFQVHPVTIPIKNLPRAFEGLTIAQISDLHAGSFFSEQPMQEARRIVESLKPDMLMITGDWVNWKADELPIILPEIHAMCLKAGKRDFAPLGVWGCLGNHDHYVGGQSHQELLDAVRAAGVNLLVNQNTTFSIDGEILQLAAIDNVGLRQNYGDLNKALNGLSAEHSTILLAHDPTFWDKKVHGKTSILSNGDELSIDLLLAGHTHGGQMGVQLAGMELSPASLLYRQCAGLYASEHGTAQHIYVNRGIGTTGVPVRIGIPPEITLITLKRT
ncbi:MAG: metallophosphoesterase [Candidatus Kapaibacterium sp.]|nr:MAG: metallophosphoesterase [Candidatus Kapabacteria bacterium]